MCLLGSVMLPTVTEHPVSKALALGGLLGPSARDSLYNSHVQTKDLQALVSCWLSPVCLTSKALLAGS